jgi:hypothetical protein
MTDIVLDELRSIADRCLALAKNGNGYKSNKAAYRTLGTEADDMGGIEAMRHVYYGVVEMWEGGDFPRSPDDFHPSELQAAWDGVGEWHW